MKTLGLYHTKTGHTLEAINPMVEGLRDAGAEVKVILAKEFRFSMLSDYEAFIVGTPCWGGSSGVTSVASPIIKAIKSIPDNGLTGKLCGGLAIHAKYGGEATLNHLEKLLARKGCDNLISAPVVKAGTLMSLFKGPSVAEESIEALRRFGKDFPKTRLN